MDHPALLEGPPSTIVIDGVIQLCWKPCPASFRWGCVWQ